MLNLGTTYDRETVERAVRRGPLAGLAVDVVDGDVILTGAVPGRKDEWGGDAMLGEEDRNLVLGLIDTEEEQQSRRARARTLRDKPVMTQTELTEAVKLLLAIVLEEE